MAHFAKLDNNNNVLEVIVVNNSILDSNSEEESGIAFLTQWSEGYTNWKQTSYNGSFRKNFAAIGGVYDSTRNAFIHPKPYNSWILDNTTCQWKPPIEYPNDNNSYWWDESNQSWSLITFQPEEE
jgi:hypothetical protein